MAKRISVVISQGQSKNPAKRNLEESIVTALMMESGIDVTVIPHLYDLKPDGTGMLALKSISGNMIVLSWLFERAAHWVLDRNDIRGQVGEVELKRDPEDEEDDEEENANAEAEEKERVVDTSPRPDRMIYCLDLRVSENSAEFVREIQRIQNERSMQVVSLGIGSNGFGSNGSASNGSASNDDGKASPAQSAGEVRPETQARFEQPTNGTALAKDGSGLESPSALTSSETAKSSETVASNGSAAAILNRIEEQAGRRWYPVIDYSRCTNCMECIDFCLFGVYGVDRLDSILVEQPDNCRKGCPACSRVCPENAIIFPQHKTPAIAGSDEVGGTLKIDLSKLFGAPDDGKSPEEIAAIERDEQLIAAGRDAVGMSLPKRRVTVPDEPKDELDSLVDELDDLDL